MWTSERKLGSSWTVSERAFEVRMSDWYDTAPFVQWGIKPHFMHMRERTVPPEAADAQAEAVGRQSVPEAEPALDASSFRNNTG